MRNLTELALKNKILMWYFIIVTAIGGIFFYGRLGRMEDPSFTINQMIITAAWPGASAEEMSLQVTDKLESQFRNIPGVKEITSKTRPGTTLIYVKLRDDIPKEKIRDTWRDVRNFGNDIQRDLPKGVYGPYYNDRFDDVFGVVYALTGDGYSLEEMRQYAERLRRQLVNIEKVQKVEILGQQEEKVYIELEIAKLGELGISPSVLAEAIKGQNEMAPAGMIETSTDNIYLRYSGSFKDVEEIGRTPIHAGGRIFYLGDIANIERRYAEPGEPTMYFNGEPAIGIAVSMESGGNIITLGEVLKEQIDSFTGEFPAGLELHKVADQSAVVVESIDDFISTLREAIIIILVVSFLSLGLRTGMVVAGCIPLVLAAVFCGMYMWGIDLHKVSLGALIISLGLLVDDAIIAVEQMSIQLEKGYNRFEAACYAFRATAKPMLTGTLITCAGFIPVAFSKGMAAEFCQALFPVISMALVISWLISVMVAPLFGYYLIKPKAQEEVKEAPYNSKFYDVFRQLLRLFMTHSRLVIVGTVVAFVASIGLLGLVKQEFFPPSIRPEIIVDLELPEGSSKASSAEVAGRFAEFLNGENIKDDIDSFSYYVGEGSPRFVLVLDPKTPADNLSQFVIVSKDTEARDRLIQNIREGSQEYFPEVRSKLSVLQTGPPAAYPVMLAVSGYDAEKVRSIAHEITARMSKDANYVDVNMDWNEKSKILQMDFDHEKLKALGLSPSIVAQNVYTQLSGASVAQLYDGDRTIDIELRLAEEDRSDLGKIGELPIFSSGGYVPLSQLAKLSFKSEYGLLNRINMQPTVMVQANIRQGTANDETMRLYESLEDIREALPMGYSIKMKGAVADSDDSMKYLMVPLPAMIFVIMTLLMLQLRSGKDMLLTLLTAPLGIIGVAVGMLIFNQAMGFVAILGVLALSGMIIRNSVILIDQIQKHIQEGEAPWDAVVDSAVLRFRPIMLTAAAAILGMVPLMSSTFWGPMAVAIASGLIVATVLTLLVLPAMYVMAYNIKK